LLSIGFLLLHPLGQPCQFVHGVFEAVAGTVDVGAVHQGGGLTPSPAGAARYGRNHLEVPQKFGR
jgi:hypothetical protein